jgi:hypothetical protein
VKYRYGQNVNGHRIVIPDQQHDYYCVERRDGHGDMGDMGGMTEHGSEV